MPSFGRPPALLLFLTFFGGYACSTPACDREGQAPQTYSGGRTNAARTVYETSDFGGPFLFFPSGRTYRLPHGLSDAPVDVGIYLSFADDGAVAPSAGNQAFIESVNEEFVEIRNDTCAEFFVRVTASTAGEWEAEPGSDAGASSGSGPGSDAGADSGI